MRKGLLGVAFALVALGATGCQGAQEGGESGTGVLLLDKDARSAGFAFEIAGKRQASVLPIEVSDDDDVALVGPSGRATLSGAEGELLHVKGRQGKLESLGIGEDVEADRVLVEGSEEAARALGEMLAGEVTEANGAWQIKAENALQASAGLPAPDGLIAVSPAEKSANDDIVQGVERAVEAFGGMKHRANRVGKLADGAFDQVLAKMQDYGLPPAVECADPIVGTWMSQDYDERFTDWYVFTMKVKRVQGTTDVIGEIEAHSWNGGPLDTTPTSCDAGGGHWIVKMTATGTYQGGELRFGATSWHLEQSICGRAPQPWEYNLDQFSGTVDKSGFRALNNDGGRMIDQPTPFRRVSCQ